MVEKELLKVKKIDYLHFSKIKKVARFRATFTCYF